ncbi:MAG: hypothetical protein QME48_06510 [bacterium]|uniref:N-acetyltransferase domain-containing protein n=2 Tax=Bacteria candidate phyla TaxID=1783234 RepID=A0A117M751_UNCT6|nr:MAG: Uncharacterized protein XD76_0122 [candidate division TA06 bacterium 32_111]KUK88062.1 MAG: Uncharacterized protein XE03_0068 [candidate division TA06 bacterium 34_109]MDI6700868.1 hypothetical protein [bacterium]HAF06994.1 hypothetical protein [candidate division WOR-3 bacterium]HCP16908.1 hypothetical protein [candidate division WOR-3 bacterium]
MNIRIDYVKSKKDWVDFLKLPWSIYKDNPYWVMPLLTEVKETLDIEKNPFWKHARREIFLARRDGETVGRIVAIINENHINFHEERTGFFGFFECIKDFEVAQSLWDEAKRWLKINKMDVMRGPVSPSMNDECAFLLEGFDKPPTVMMPYTQLYYLELAERYGFKKQKTSMLFSKKQKMAFLNGLKEW